MNHHLYPPEIIQQELLMHHNYQVSVNNEKQTNSLQLITQKLSVFNDDESINLETSIPILRQVGILNQMESFQQVKIRLEIDQDEESTLRQEAKFLYYLWQLINQQQIDCRQLKEIIKFTLIKEPQQLKQILIQIYNSPGKVQDYLQACTFLYERSHKIKKINGSSFQDNFFSFNSQKQVHKQNSYYQKNTKSSNIASPILSNSSSKKMPMQDLSNFVPSNFNFTIQLSADQQKNLVGRLYQNDKYKKREEQKKEMEKKKAQEQMKECTFKPNTAKRGRSISQKGKSVSKNNHPIKGFEKAVSRIKAGTQKNKTTQALRDYKPIGQNYQKLRNKGLNPPKFLERKKEEEKVLFIISFDLGKYKTNVKIREGDTEQSVAERLCKIYSLKQDFYDEICEIVRNQLEAYYMQLYENQTASNLHNDL